MTPTPVTLDDLVRAGVAREVVGDGATAVSGVRHDSRAVEPGDLFVAIPGAVADGVRFVPDAVKRGAAAVLAEARLAAGVPLLVADDARAALGRAAAVVYRDPTRAIPVVGITGTNGKTTTSYLLESVLLAAGERPAVMGTITFRGPGVSRPAPFTTPEADDIARFAREMVDAGATHLVMEVSSHGLALKRVDDVRFRVAAFTNLTQDHLDFHGDLERYGEAKARLFTELEPAAAVVNVDDPFGAALAARSSGTVLRCSQRADAEAELRVLAADLGRHGIRATVATPAGPIEIASPLLGAHNLENLLVAAGCALALQLSKEKVAAGLSAAAGAPGRLERVPHPGDVAVLVDYAHTPDALARALAALRPITPGRLLCVFGCGGDRDRTKRPRMGAAAASGADLCVVTSDNPRTEEPEAIVAEIVPGVTGEGQKAIAPAALATAARGHTVVVDRREAIRLAVRAARPGDTVLIAGKGHEDYQIVGKVKRPFDDRVEARAAMEEGS